MEHYRIIGGHVEYGRIYIVDVNVQLVNSTVPQIYIYFLLF